MGLFRPIFPQNRSHVDSPTGSVPSEADLEQQGAILAEWLDTENLDALIVTPFRSDSLLEELARASEAGIPIINTDEIIPEEQANEAGVTITTRIASNNVRAGTIAGQYVLDALAPGSEVAVIEGAPDTKSSQDRVLGFIETTELNGLRVVASRPADWNTERAYEVTTELLAEYPELQAIFTANDGMALGAMQALSENEREDVVITSVDAIPDALAAVEAGTLNGTVAQYPEEMAVLAVEAALKVVNGRPVPPEIESPVVLITDETLELAASQLGDPSLDGIEVYALTKNLDNPFFLDMVAGYEAAAADLGISVEVGTVATANDQDEQRAIMQGWLADEALEALIVTPLDGELLLEDMAQATEMGISLLNVDEIIPPTVADEFAIGIDTRIASNNVRAGSFAADYAVANLEPGSEVAVIEGVANTQSSLDRVQGFIETAEGNGLRVVASRPANWSTDEAYVVTQELLAQYGDLKAIFAANDGMAFGVMQALEEAEMLDEVIVLSVDAVPEAREAVLDGRLAGTVAQFPDEMAYLAVENAIKVIEGRPISPTIESPVVLLTQAILTTD